MMLEIIHIIMLLLLLNIICVIMYSILFDIIYVSIQHTSSYTVL